MRGGHAYLGGPRGSTHGPAVHGRSQWDALGHIAAAQGTSVTQLSCVGGGWRVTSRERWVGEGGGVVEWTDRWDGPKPLTQRVGGPIGPIETARPGRTKVWVLLAVRYPTQEISNFRRARDVPCAMVDLQASRTSPWPSGMGSGRTFCVR